MRKVILILLIALVANSASAQEDGPEVNYEGLSRQQRGLFRESWVDMNVDLPQYDKLIVIDPFFEFRAVKRTATGAARRSNQRKFYISDANRERLIATVSDIIEEELRRSSHFTLVAEPGPDVMILRVGILDIVSRVPPEQLGRHEIYLSSVGEATLVVELRDSLSLETIFRGIERRAAQSPGSRSMRNTTVTNWAEVSRLARRWARRMREGLDAIHTQ